jgi:hypothetical protein
MVYNGVSANGVIIIINEIMKMKISISAIMASAKNKQCQ